MLCIATMMLTLVACGSKNDDVNVDSSSDDSQNVTSESDSNVKDDVVVSESVDVDSSSGEETTNDVSENKASGNLVICGVEYQLPVESYIPIDGFEIDEEWTSVENGSIALKTPTQDDSRANDPISLGCDVLDQSDINALKDFYTISLFLGLENVDLSFTLDGTINESSTKDDIIAYYGDDYEESSDSYYNATTIEYYLNDNEFIYKFYFDDDNQLTMVYVTYNKYAKD
jgi:hypothetical protein